MGQQSPVLWYASATNVTDVMVALYDQAHPVATAAPAAGASKAAPTPPPAPPTKKQ